MRRLAAVDGNRNLLEARLAHAARGRRGNAVTARGQRAGHPRRADGFDHGQPVMAQIRLAADQRDFPDAHLVKLPDQIERFRGGQTAAIAESP